MNSRYIPARSPELNPALSSAMHSRGLASGSRGGEPRGGAGVGSSSNERLQQAHMQRGHELSVREVATAWSRSQQAAARSGGGNGEWMDQVSRIFGCHCCFPISR